MSVSGVFSYAPKPADIKPAHVYRYADLVKKTSGNKSARNDVSTLQHMLTKAIEWGLMDRNQLIGQVKLKNNPARNRLVEDWEIIEVYSLKSSYRGVQFAQPYIRLKLLPGLRLNALLRLKLSDIREDGIHVQPSKTNGNSGKQLIFKWDDELRAVIETNKQIKPRRIGDSHLFITRQGKPYVDPARTCAIHAQDIRAGDSLVRRGIRRSHAPLSVRVPSQGPDTLCAIVTAGRQ